MKSFVLSKKDVKLFLDYLKIYSFKELEARPFLQSISLWQIDGSNYVCASDGRSLLMLDVPDLGIKITKEMSQKSFRMKDVKAQDILFEVTEDDVSVFIGDKELEPLNTERYKFPQIDRVLPGGSSFRKINEITLWGSGIGYRDPMFYALLNGSEEGGINILYLNFMFKNFKNIEYCPNEKHPDEGAYEFRNDSFRMICMPVNRDGGPLTLGEFNNYAKASLKLPAELEKLVVSKAASHENLIRSFTVPNKYTAKILKFFKLINNRDLKPSDKGIRFFYRDGIIYVVCTDGLNTLFIEVDEYSGRIDDSIEDYLFNISDISAKDNLTVSIYESGISVSSEKKDISYVERETDLDFDLLTDVPGKEIREVFLMYGKHSGSLHAQINKSICVDARFLDLFCKDGVLPDVSDLIKDKYERVILSDSTVSVCCRTSHPGFDRIYIDAEYYLNNVDAKKSPISEYLLSLVKFPDETAEFKVQSHIIWPDWIVSYWGKLAIINSEDKVIQPIDVKYRGNGGYKLEFGLKPGELVLEFDANYDLTVLQSGKKYNGSIDYREAPNFPDLDKTAKNKLGKVYAYERQDRKGRLEYFELNGMLYPLWKLLYLSSNKNLRYGYIGSNDYLLVTDGHVFILFDEYIPLAHKDKQISLHNGNHASSLVRNGLSSYFSLDYVAKFFEGIIETPDRDSAIGDGMVFSNRFSAEEIVDWNDEYQYAMEVTEQIGRDLVDEFTQSGEIKRIIDSIDVNISNILKDYANKIDKSIDSRGLDFVANKIISRIGFKGNKEDLLVIMEACGIDEEYITKVVHQSIKGTLSKNYGDF